MNRGAIGAYVAALIGLSLLGQPLGHDEAQYALGGAALLGRAVSAYPLHRPIGMQVVAAPGVWAGGGELAFHAIAIAATLGFLAAAWAYARRAYGARTAAWTLAVVATSFAVVRHAVDVLPDAIAGVLVLTFATILVGGLGPGPRVTDPPGAGMPAPGAATRRWRLVWLGPAAAGAFYLRYGSIGVIGAIALAAAIVWRRRLVANAAPLAAATAILAAALAPHLIWSARETGSALGVLRLSSEAAGRAYTGDGLVFYATAWWLWLGPAAAACVAAGFAAAIARRGEVAAFAGLASLIAIVVLGVDAHGEARFVLVPEVLLVASGIEAIVAWVMPRPRAAAALIAASLLGALIASDVALARERRTFGVAVAAGAAIRQAAAGTPCRVWSGQWTQLEWYSGCAGATIPDAIDPGVIDRPSFLVWFDAGRRQPPHVLDEVRAARGGVRAEHVARIAGDGSLWGGADVYRLVPAR